MLQKLPGPQEPPGATATGMHWHELEAWIRRRLVGAWCHSGSPGLWKLPETTGARSSGSGFMGTYRKPPRALGADLVLGRSVLGSIVKLGTHFTPLAWGERLSVLG